MSMEGKLNTPASSGRRTKKSKNPNALSGPANLVINIFFWLYSAACVLPLALVIIVSFTDENSILRRGYTFVPEKWSTFAYEFLFKDWQQLVHSAEISVIVTVIGTLLSLFFMALYAYPISRPDFPHRNFFSFFMFFTMLFNGGLVPWYLVYTRMLHLKDNIWALIIPLMISAFYIMIMRTFFANTIPGALIESAKIDGAGELRTFIQIVLPLSLPVLATVALFQTLGYWNDWFLSMIYISMPNGSNLQNVNLQYLMYKTMLDIQFITSNPTALSAITAAGGDLKIPQESVRMAMAVVGIGPIVFAYPFFQKYFVQGLTVGAVKG
ncbi:carbohydrate ABC transporter permease [Gorillibacterium timonense]|uniref:carbohydrate ABC transporter permease n=1 Tax=Gorillibacterium timonense TaxID=1689269 RepID=UPI001F3EBFF5|nr:carbohydrate ABC transporter permease [Gorillibacterium timonense]